MHRRVIAGFVAGAVAAAAPAAADEAKPAPSLEELLDRIERLEQDKTRMQDEIDELRHELGDNWLSERRAEEIKALVGDVLADADGRSSLLQEGMTAGWDDGFFLSSSDRRFLLRVGGVLQARWVWNFHDQPDRYVYGSEIPRAKLIFSGHLYTPDLTFRVQADMGKIGQEVMIAPGVALLEDAWIRYLLTDEWALRLGQFRVPFNREELVRSWNQQLVERSLVNEQLNLGYTQGVELVYADRDRRLIMSFNDGGLDQLFGQVDGPLPQNSTALSSQTEYAVTARYEHKVAGSWDQFSTFTSPPGDDFGLLVGVAGHYQFVNPGTPAAFRDQDRWLLATVDVSAAFGGANLYGALIWDYQDVTNFNINAFGGVLQGGMYFTEKFEAVVRFEYGHVLVDGNPLLDDLYLVTVGGNYYFEGNDVKLSTDIGFGFGQVSSVWASDIAGWRADATPDAAPQVVIRVQLQLVF